MKKSVLIVRFSSLGDVLLTTGVIRELATQFPNIDIDVLTSHKFSEVFSQSPYIRNVIVVDTSQSALTMLTKRKQILQKFGVNNHYDYVIDLQNSLRSRIFTLGLSPKTSFIKKYRIEKLAMVRKKKRITLPSIPDRYRETIHQFFPIKNDGNGLELFISNQKVEKIQHRIGIAPGAKHFTKRLPIEKWKQVIELLISNGKSVVLVGGKEDSDICKELKEEFSGDVFNKSGAVTLAETAIELQGCEVVISNDSSVAHLASAFKIPVVSIFGSTTPGFGFLPYQTQNIVIENPSLACRPCTHIGRSSCPIGHFECMNSIDSSAIFTAVQHLQPNITENT